MSEENSLVRQETIKEAFITGDGVDNAINEVSDIVRGYEHNLSTMAGRKKTASLSAKVSKTKVIIDNIGKDLVSEWKNKAKVVDANRKKLRDSFDELRDEARKPLTDWEAEQSAIEAEKLAAEEAKKLAELIESDHEIAIILNDKYDDDAEAAIILAAQKEEARLAELREKIAEEERVKAEKSAAEAIENAKQVEREAAKAIEAAAESDKRREEAEERAKLEAEQAERNRADAKRESDQAIIDAAQAARERAKQDQRDIEAAELAAQEKRESNKRHIGKIRKETKDSIMALGFNEADAKKLVLAISNKEVANVVINY